MKKTQAIDLICYAKKMIRQIHCAIKEKRYQDAEMLAKTTPTVIEQMQDAYNENREPTHVSIIIARQLHDGGLEHIGKELRKRNGEDWYKEYVLNKLEEL